MRKSIDEETYTREMHGNKNKNKIRRKEENGKSSALLLLQIIHIIDLSINNLQLIWIQF
jgi:hypothetical protein